MSDEIFKTNAREYWDAGYSVMPVEPGHKKPAKEIKGWSGYCNNLPNAMTQAGWLRKYSEYGIGLLLGAEYQQGYRLSAVDVDDDRFVAVTLAILGKCPCGKRGKKGETFFVRAETDKRLKSTQLRNTENKGIIDVLVTTRMTVIPPSIHPDTEHPYEWIGISLLDCKIDQLPTLDVKKIALLKLVVGSEYTAAITSGETTHDAGVALTAQLVSFGCGDEEIEEIVRALLPLNYDGNSLEELSGWIASAREKGFDMRSGLPLDDTVARQIAEAFSPLVFVFGDGFLRYVDGYWNTVSDRDIDRRAKEILSEIIGPNRQVRPLLDNVRRCLQLNIESPNFGAKGGLICVRNGTVEVSSGKLLEHSPDHELRYRLDIEFDPDAECPIYEEQTLQTFVGDQKAIETFDEFAGLTLVSDMRFQKALYLVGEGGSGKSTLLRVVESMHDPDAVSVTPLDRIDNERYLTNLVRKQLCISFDVQTNRKVFGEAFVRITGGDPVAVRKLFHEVEGRVTPTVRFMGSLNPDMPNFIAAPDALERRLIFLCCGPYIANPDPNRVDQLLAERPGILTRWVRALQRLQKRGHFNVPDTSKLEIEDYVHSQEPFDDFIAERLLKDPNARTTVSKITEEYASWAIAYGEPRLSSNVIGRKLRRAGFRGGFERAGERGQNVRIVHAQLLTPSWAKK